MLGGAYDHTEVNVIDGPTPFETGVWYSPDIELRALDVAIHNDEGNRQFVSYAEAAGHLQAAGVPFMEALFIGKYADAITQPVAFTTTLPALLGLPPINDNLAEGVVIKPRQPVVIDGHRPMVKRNHPRFEEDKRYHQAQRWQTAPPQAAIVGAPLDVLEYEMMCRVTANRLDAVRSKLGDTASARSLLGELVSDVRAELQAEQAEAWRSLSAEERALLEATLEQEAESLIASVS